MARQPRFEYPGAVYHVMARGDGGKPLFLEKDDHESFLFWLEKACGSHGWRVHAWVLTGNHFHLLLQTPEPNLSSGMRVLLGTFSQAWNSRHQRRGHVFQGRYKAVPVAGERAADARYFKSVADYIHLNPARAGLAGGAKGKLVDFPWSSLRHYSKGNPPPWLVIGRVLDAFKLSHDRRRRAAYVTWLEARASSDGGRIDEASMEALRRGWYLGKESFRDKLLDLMDKAKSKVRKKDSHSGGAVRAHNEGEAGRLIVQVAADLDLLSRINLSAGPPFPPFPPPRPAIPVSARVSERAARHPPPHGPSPIHPPWRVAALISFSQAASPFRLPKTTGSLANRSLSRK